MAEQFTIEDVSLHVTRFALPTLTLPPLDSTNTYVIQSGSEAIVVDCGSDDDDVVAQVAHSMSGRGIETVLGYVATHYHLDHTRGLGRLARHFPAPIFCHALDAVQTASEIGCPSDDIEHVAAVMRVGQVQVDILHQPGHTHGHLHLHVRPDNVLLVGDHMAGTGTVWIGPPDGHMADYFVALEQIRDSDAALVLPGHGAPIPDADRAGATLLAHRIHRETEIQSLLKAGRLSLDSIVDALYGDRGLGAALWVARHTTQAHLAHLIDLGHVQKRCSAPDFIMLYELSELEGLHA